ncbi:hypothetical protein ACDA63_07100 [Uliginosibacterium sp. sgz301328]|uniref:gp53-like domain-containing protein n=1 Tax=Uliginosibacterium sp. sgz301328 TaxID=3243764 RepID=UPI00359D7D7F
MPTNDFRAFASSSGANVLTQADYVALSDLIANGFLSGTAKSEQLNKVWRQGSIMAAVIGQFICDKTGQDAVDDGTTAVLVAALGTAVKVAAQEMFSGSNQNLVANGYQRLPGGLILQWGNAVIGSGTSVTFPITFGGGCFGVWLTPNTSALLPANKVGIVDMTSAPTGTGFIAYSSSQDNAGGGWYPYSAQTFWLAIGK